MTDQRMVRRPPRFWFVWAWPIALGVLSTVGLLAALLGTGWLHWVSWICLAVPVLVIVRHVWAPSRTPQAE